MRLPDKPMEHVQFLVLLVTAVLLMPFLTSDSTLDPTLSPQFLAWAIALLALSPSFLLQVLSRGGTIDCTVLRHGIFPAFLGYFLFSLVSLSRAVNLAEGIYEVLKVFMSVVFLLAAVVILSRRSTYIALLAKAVVSLAIVLSLMGLGQYFRHGAVERPGSFLMTGTMGNKNLFASALFLMLPFCGYAALTFRARWRWAGASAIASVVTLILLSETRAVWFALLAATAMTAIAIGVLMRSGQLEIPEEMRRQAVRMACLTVALVLLLGLAVGVCYFSSHTVGDMVDSAINRDSLRQRISMWRNTLRIVGDAPVLGIGAGNWKIVFPSYRVLAGWPPEWLTTIFFVRPHNDFLWVLAEIGAIGFVFYLLTFVFPIFYAFKTLPRANPGDALLLLLMLHGIAGYLVVASFCFPRERVFHSILLLLMMAVVTCIYHRTFPLTARTSRRPMIAFLLLAHVVLPLAIVVGYFRLTAEIHTKRALAARHVQDWSSVVREIDQARSIFATMDPMSTPLAWYRGEANFRGGYLSQAREDYTEALKVHPHHVLVLNNLATCYELEGRRQEAIRYYEKAIAIHPHFSEASANLVAVHFNEGQYEEAREILLRHNPDMRNPTLERYLRLLDAALEEREEGMPDVTAARSSPQTGRAAEHPQRGLQGVHRLWSSTYGRYFYTIDNREKDAYIGCGVGLWIYEGIAYYAFTEGGSPGLCPVHRFYSQDLDTHFYTSALAEAESLVQNYPQKWRYEGTVFYVYAEGQQPPNASPIYRFWSPSLGYHHFTADEKEKNKMRTIYSPTWTYEGVAWYVPPAAK